MPENNAPLSDFKKLRLNGPSWVLVTLLFLVCVGVGSYWSATCQGLYLWFANWQMRSFESYYPGLTGVYTFLVLFAALAVVLAFLAKLDVIRTSDGKPVPFTAELLKRNLASMNGWTRQSKYRLAFTLVAIYCVGSGTLDLISGMTAGNQKEVEVTQGEELSRTDWVRLRGRVLREASVTFGETDRDNSRETYTPLVPKKWNVNEPVKVVLKKSGSMEIDEADAFDGMVSFAILPGIIRQTFERNGLTVAVDAVVVNVGESPTGTIFLGIMQLGFGLSFLIGLAGYSWLKSRQAKKLAAAAETAELTPLARASNK